MNPELRHLQIITNFGLAFLIGLVFVSELHAQEKQIFELEGFTQAVFDMPGVKSFYEEVFDVEFEERIIQDYILWEGKWMSYELLLCPAELAENNSNRNRFQMDVKVNDLSTFRQRLDLLEVRYEINRRSQGELTLTLYDPDGNSMVIFGR